MGQKKLLKEVSGLIEQSLSDCDALESALSKHDAAKIFSVMAKLRVSIDELEGFVPANLWPLPSYAEILLLNA